MNWDQVHPSCSLVTTKIPSQNKEKRKKRPSKWWLKFWSSHLNSQDFLNKFFLETRFWSLLDVIGMDMVNMVLVLMDILSTQVHPNPYE
jgi:hypothetical protein